MAGVVDGENSVGRGEPMDKLDSTKEDQSDLPDRKDLEGHGAVGDRPDHLDLADRSDVGGRSDQPDLPDYVAEAQAPYRRLGVFGSFCIHVL